MPYKPSPEPLISPRLTKYILWVIISILGIYILYSKINDNLENRNDNTIQVPQPQANNSLSQQQNTINNSSQSSPPPSDNNLHFSTKIVDPSTLSNQPNNNSLPPPNVSHNRRKDIMHVPKESSQHTNIMSNDNEAPNSNVYINKNNPYGSGYGNITIYKTCSNCQNMEVSIDNDFVGTLKKFYKEDASPSNCEDSNCLYKNVLVGYHTITAKDINNTTWNKTIYVNEGVCEKVALNKNKDANNVKKTVHINNYGEGNGTVTLYVNAAAKFYIFVDGINKGTLDTYFKRGTEPNCGQYGTLSFSLAKGKHIYKAMDTVGQVWKGTFMINEGECTKIIANSFIDL